MLEMRWASSMIKIWCWPMMASRELAERLSKVARTSSSSPLSQRVSSRPKRDLSRVVFPTWRAPKIMMAFSSWSLDLIMSDKYRSIILTIIITQNFQKIK